MVSAARRLDFDAINRAGLASLPALLRRARRCRARWRLPMRPPDRWKRRPPGADQGAPMETSKGLSGAFDDEQDTNRIAHLQVPPHGDAAHDVKTLRWIWWQHRGLGYTYPTQKGLILLDGGQT